MATRGNRSARHTLLDSFLDGPSGLQVELHRNLSSSYTFWDIDLERLAQLMPGATLKELGWRSAPGVTVSAAARDPDSGKIEGAAYVAPICLLHDDELELNVSYAIEERLGGQGITKMLASLAISEAITRNQDAGLPLAGINIQASAENTSSRGLAVRLGATPNAPMDFFCERTGEQFVGYSMSIDRALQVTTHILSSRHGGRLAEAPRRDRLRG